jgi:hypothetical protein
VQPKPKRTSDENNFTGKCRSIGRNCKLRSSSQGARSNFGQSQLRDREITGVLV